MNYGMACLALLVMTWGNCAAAFGQPPAQQQLAFRADGEALQAARALSSGAAVPFAQETQILQPPAGDFPPLPPHPEPIAEGLLPLDEELWEHGGSYLFQPEGDRLHWPQSSSAEMLRLPESWQAPQPFTRFADFLGADPIVIEPYPRWPGGYAWEPRLVGYGAHQSFGFALEQNNRRQDVLGQQLLLDLDFQWTGTERVHLHFRPLGRRNTGGSYYQFSDPDGYVDNSVVGPQRYWLEAELHSLLGAYVDPFSPLDVNLVVGKFPFALHNSLLMNDEITGVVVSKNTIYAADLSNLNIQTFYAFEDVDTYVNNDSQLLGTHITAEHRRTLYEFTYAYVNHDGDNQRNAHFAGLSRTAFIGPLTLAGRALFKWGDESGAGAGQLFSVEANYSRILESRPLGIESAVLFCNAFRVSDGWTSLGGGNFNRLRTAFEVNPVIRIAAGTANTDTVGVASGVQLFRRNQDESFVPEVAFESPAGEVVWGVGLRYQRKTSARSFLETLGVLNFSDDPQFDREGAFLSHTILF
jgi:hypothetical protein